MIKIVIATILLASSASFAAVTYHIRVVCETEIGNGMGWHYYRYQSHTVDTTKKDPDHQTAVHRDYVIESSTGTI